MAQRCKSDKMWNKIVFVRNTDHVLLVLFPCGNQDLRGTCDHSISYYQAVLSVTLMSCFFNGHDMGILILAPSL